MSEFGGPAWTFDDTTGQYHLHIHLAAQPSLNWRHPRGAGTLRGTPTVYQGDELGMVDTDVPADVIQDPWERQVPGMTPHRRLLATAGRSRWRST